MRGMKHIGSLALLLVAVLAATTASAQTNVSGTLSTDTTWDLAGSPYVVTSTVTVIGTDGADAVTTLTIEPGVEVRFRTNTRLQIGNNSTVGALVADGNAGGGPATILFTSDNASPVRGDWQRVMFEGAARGDLSVIRNAVVEYAGRGTGGAGVTISHNAGTVTLDEITIRESGGHGLRAQTGPADISNCVIETTDDFDIRLENSATVLLGVDTCTFSSVSFAGANPEATWSAATVINWGAVTSVIDVDQFGALYAAASFDSNVAGAEVQINGTNMERDATWGPRGGTIRINANKVVRGEDGPDGVTTLTLEPGTTVEMGPADQIQIGNSSLPGRLIADGDSGPGAPAQILFTSDQTTPVPGDWRRIAFGANAKADSVFRNVRVEYAGSNNNEGAIHLLQNEGPITIEDTVIRDNLRNGLRAEDPFHLDGCTFENNALADVRLNGNSNVVGSVLNSTLSDIDYAGNQPDVSWSGNTFTDWGTLQSRVEPNAVSGLLANNTFLFGPTPSLLIRPGNVGRDSLWSNRAGRLVVDGEVTTQGLEEADSLTTLTLEAGTELAFNSGGQLVVSSNQTTAGGELIAEGTASEPILLTSSSLTPAPGDWRNISVRPQPGPNTRLSHVILEYGGSSGHGLYMEPDTFAVPLRDITIRHSAGHGIRYAGGTIDLAGCVISDVADYSISYGALSADGVVSGCTFESVSYTGSSPTAVKWNDNDVHNWGAVRSLLPSTDISEFIAGNRIQAVPGAITDVLAQVVSEDGRWTDALGTYNMTGFSLSIRGNDANDGTATLTLGPGVEVTTRPFDSIFVGDSTGAESGRLILDGRAAHGGVDPVIIRSSTPSAPEADWNGIAVFDEGYLQILGGAEIYDTGEALSMNSSSLLEQIDGLKVGNSTDGIRISATAAVTGELMQRLDLDVSAIGLDVSTHNLDVIDSNILAGTMAILNQDPTPFCIDASSTYWGDPSGPSGNVPSTGCEIDTPSGSGSEISEGVIFDNARTTPFVAPPNNPFLYFSSGDRIFWDPVDGAVEYDVYRQPLSSAGPGAFAVCRNDLDIDRTDEEWIDLEDPLIDSGFSYLVAAVNSSGTSGSIGRATAGTRLNSAACP
ncbi:hypothetical protein ABI59_08830 [Acidobacteria bacterium Mor1]|nr:hypothetical protein ABI59_08830 [Acidobacteria bacterium Mor1]